MRNMLFIAALQAFKVAETPARSISHANQRATYFRAKESAGEGNNFNSKAFDGPNATT